MQPPASASSLPAVLRCCPTAGTTPTVPRCYRPVGHVACGRSLMGDRSSSCPRANVVVRTRATLRTGGPLLSDRGACSVRTEVFAYELASPYRRVADSRTNAPRSRLRVVGPGRDRSNERHSQPVSPRPFCFLIIFTASLPNPGLLRQPEDHKVLSCRVPSASRPPLQGGLYIHKVRGRGASTE